eukprot:COSAG01_NODE_34267_length_550_cov_1.368071_1_plen_128_part_10
MMDLCRASENAPLPRFPAAFGDNTTGTQLVAGIALALLHRHQTGEGQLVDVSLLAAGMWSMSHLLTAHAAGNPFAAGARPAIRGTTEPGVRRTMVSKLIATPNWQHNRPAQLTQPPRIVICSDHGHGL